MGHEAGDSLLKAISERLKDAVRHGDTVARLGGDEFVLLLEDILSEEDATLVAERIQQNLVSPMEIAGREIFGSASVGIAFCRGGNTDAESIMRDADTAMYHAKTNGKAGYALFHPRMNIQVVERLEMEHALRLALENKELHLVYQPIMSLENQSVREVEALLRWTHPERGLISPVKFIPVAEETGLIIPIGRWVLEQACRQAKEWEAEVPDTSSLIMGVNVSAKQLQQSDFVEMVLETLGQARLTPSRLKIEITESLMMSNIEDSQRKLTALKEVGVHVAVDDFGTGYASMAYLSTLPIDTLKIDRSFVQRLNQQAEHSAVVGAIISLANSLGITVTSEGIETPEQLSTLVAMGVPLGQGFYFSKPLTSADFRAYLQGVDCWHAQETVRRVA
jgi:predicted signal transduction protein with EAL and GGDEF domain